ncbi:MAG: UMP kinase [Phycisphaerae bacterium]|nr:UMP kinase [Phycisphaerae bacterium]
MPTHATRPSRLKRVLLKLSGEAFCEKGGFGVESRAIGHIAREVADAAKAGAQVAVVVGGGNIIRGATLAEGGLLDQAVTDHMGMLGTVINGLALREALEHEGCAARCMSAVPMPSVAEPFIRLRAIRHMEKGRVVILAGGTGNPFFTTDSAAALRAAELGCDAVLKATKVDGVYSADPKKDPKATRYSGLTFAEAIEKRLKIMDMTALALCQERRMPVLVFDFDRAGNIRKAVEGGDVGTMIRV